jgi:phosphomannomutase
MGVFKAYDIRGIYNEGFNIEDVYKIGFFIPKLLKAQKVLVGHDTRISSPEIFEMLSKGITDSGADVYYIGLSTTPMVYFATAEFGFDASVQITASHNSKEYNGFKISKTSALPVGYDTGLKELEKMVNNEEIIVSEKKGRIIKYEVKNKYISFLKEKLNDISNIKIAVDCSNGMASILIREILGDNVIYLYDELDGNFPNHEPNPLLEENVADLKKAVIDNKCDIGVIFDGDADRVIFVDEGGNFISPDLIIGVLAEYYLKKEKGKVLHDIRTSKSVSEYIEKLGGTPVMWKVGHAFAKMKMREEKCIVGGELAGHYYFRDFFSCDSGVLASLLVLNVVSKMKKEQKKISELINEIVTYVYSGEINFKLEKKQEAIEALKKDTCKSEDPVAIYDFDGYRIEFKDWWFNVRLSNTEPYLRLVTEAKTKDMLEEKLLLLEKIIENYK